MLSMEKIAACSQIHIKHINTLCGQNVEFVNVKPGGTSTQSNHWGSKGKNGTTRNSYNWPCVLQPKRWDLLSFHGNPNEQNNVSWARTFRGEIWKLSQKAHTSVQDAAWELHVTPVSVTTVAQLHDEALQTGNGNWFHVSFYPSRTSHTWSNRADRLAVCDAPHTGWMTEHFLVLTVNLPPMSQLFLSQQINHCIRLPVLLMNAQLSFRRLVPANVCKLVTTQQTLRMTSARGHKLTVPIPHAFLDSGSC